MISREVYVFLAMIICGGALAVVFDMLRAMRMVLNPSAVIVSASDILFWIFAAFVISAAAWNLNSGIFRFYEPLGIILGAVFYFLLFSKWILKLFLFIFENILKFAKFIFKILLTPPKFLYKILIVPIIGVIKNKRRKGHDTHDSSSSFAESSAISLPSETAFSSISLKRFTNLSDAFVSAISGVTFK